ncbi:mitogen-activated protein kinase kinase kinase 20-like [Amphiura filiformis]|uniref:mitogen-activated protein kinase kinase kinase 20-like n=1 Tax=Amphiura filiformis TaxID=82378 RepID=UPI003B21578B
MAYVTIPRDKLKLVKRVAQGSFGTVYKALWDAHEVAAKRIEIEDGRREVSFLSKLDHPNIVKLLGYVDDDLDFYIVLQLCEGGSLRQYLNAHRGAHLGPRFYDWSKQAGRPIAFLKRMGVVHKDIKTPNYLITNGNILKLCDFGSAKELDVTISMATETASYPWMAPELLRDNILSPTYDIYAYGVVVWELWTTDIPFEGSDSPAILIWRICNDNERPPIPPNCPKAIADLLRHCWFTDWKKRPTMEQVMSMDIGLKMERKKMTITGY